MQVLGRWVDRHWVEGHPDLWEVVQVEQGLAVVEEHLGTWMYLTCEVGGGGGEGEERMEEELQVCLCGARKFRFVLLQNSILASNFVTMRSRFLLAALAALGALLLSACECS